MVGSSTPNPNLKPYQSAIDEGKILLMVDVPASRADEIASIANNDHNAQHNWDVKNNAPDLELTMIV